jgi:RecJ-like exonuclease
MSNLNIHSSKLKKLSLEELEKALNETDNTMQYWSFQRFSHEGYKHMSDGTDWESWNHEKYNKEIAADLLNLSKYTSRYKRLVKEIDAKKEQMRKVKSSSLTTNP